MCWRLNPLSHCTHTRTHRVCTAHRYKLEDVDLSFNQIRAMGPSSVRMLLGMTRLDLTSNQLLELPATLAKPPALRTLRVGRNQLVEFPDVRPPTVELDAKARALGPTAVQAEAELCWPGLTHLDLSSNDLLTLPSSLVENATK